ncbi:MAG: ATP-binding cassette domain-containing protein, partial [Ruminiclostridium sp.]|nr:ATP-binding cassette domain-containing protein [Ruminiclostridium sp.]
MAEEYLIKCDNLSAGYEGQTVIKNLSFDVKQGDYLCIVGENGSGKSTLMKTILGLKSATCGEITFGGGLKQTEIGYLPQQT